MSGWQRSARTRWKGRPHCPFHALDLEPSVRSTCLPTVAGGTLRHKSWEKSVTVVLQHAALCVCRTVGLTISLRTCTVICRMFLVVAAAPAVLSSYLTLCLFQSGLSLDSSGTTACARHTLAFRSRGPTASDKARRTRHTSRGKSERKSSQSPSQVESCCVP